MLDELRSSFVPSPLNLCSAEVCIRITRCLLPKIRRAVVLSIAPTSIDLLTVSCGAISEKTSPQTCLQLLNARDLFRTLKFMFVSIVSALRGPLSLSESITPDVSCSFRTAFHTAS